MTEKKSFTDIVEAQIAEMAEDLRKHRAAHPDAYLGGVGLKDVAIIGTLTDAVRFGVLAPDQATRGLFARWVQRYGRKKEPTILMVRVAWGASA